TDSVTRGWQHALASLPLKPGARLLTHRSEWAGNLASLNRRAAEIGGSVEVIPSNPDGTVSLAALEAMVDDRVGLIALTWAPANGGLLNDA
ncbi:aminotransferase class V-fold PLP-dependent enzyme, partial [Escherichia coli]